MLGVQVGSWLRDRIKHWNSPCIGWPGQDDIAIKEVLVLMFYGTNLYGDQEIHKAYTCPVPPLELNPDAHVGEQRNEQGVKGTRTEYRKKNPWNISIGEDATESTEYNNSLD